MKKQIVFTNAMSQDIWTLNEGRTYIKSPNEAPEGASVKRGPKGGYYYEEPAGKGEKKPKGEWKHAPRGGFYYDNPSGGGIEGP